MGVFQDSHAHGNFVKSLNAHTNFIDIMGVFQDFHAHNKFFKSLNATFISLIPKKFGALNLKRFSAYQSCKWSMQDHC